MVHDQLFKDLLRAFFREFMELFFPNVAARLDFTRVTFLDKELFTDLPEGDQREADLVVQAFTLDNQQDLILVHFEVEARRRSTFPVRMFEYYMMLRLRHRVPVFPVVIYLSRGAGGLTQEFHSEQAVGHDVIRFQYATVGLRDLEAEDYRESDNPLVPGLSALMRVTRSGRAIQKHWSLRKTAQSGLDDARRALLTNIIETYLPLNVQEEMEFHQLMTLPESEELREMLTLYEERGILKGKRELLLRQLRLKFGELPERVRAKIEAIESETTLDTLSERILIASALDQLGIDELYPER